MANVVSSAVKQVGDVGSSIVKGVSDFASSPTGKLAIAAAAAYFTDGASLMSSLGSAGSSISSGLGDVATFMEAGLGDLAKVLSPLTDTIHSISGDLQSLNDKVITPIVGDVKATQDAASSLVKIFQGDLGKGLKGLVTLPSDLANAMSSLDAVYQRSNQEMATSQANIATDVFKPALVDGIGGPLQQVHAALTTSVFTEDQQAAFDRLDSLSESAAGDEVLAWVKDIQAMFFSSHDFFAPLYKLMWGVLKAGDFIVAEVMAQVEIVKQNALATIQPTLLDPGSTVEAWRRGLLTSDDSTAELNKHGLSPDRIQVLYDLAQFLFDPRSTVDLHARGIIDDKTRDLLMSQNNLDAGQVDALTQMMNHILGPGDIAAAMARNYVSPGVADELRQAARVTPEVMQLVQDLALTLADPKAMVALYGRQAAAEAGLMRQSLLSKPPDSIAEQFSRTQVEPEQAQLAWLSHWRVPGAEWWVDAYFRGLRTRTEVEDAFAANNIPPEIYDDIFAVEEELPPVWLIPDVVASGVWTEEQAVPQLMKLGFSEANAKVLYQYGYSKSKSSKAATAAELQKLSLSNAATMFDDGLIDDKTYQQVLVDHGYSAEAAALTVELTQYKAALAERKSAAQDIIDMANLGQIDETQAQSQLYALGLTDQEVVQWMVKLHKAKAAKAKLPSLADFGKMLKKELITPDQYIAALGLLGYSQEWAQLLMEIL